MDNLFRHIRRKFGTGLFIILPLFITAWVLYFLFSLIDSWITPSLMGILKIFNISFVDTLQGRILIPLVGIMMLVFFLYLLGVLGSNLFGKTIVRLFEERMMRIPFVKSIYGGSKQILEAFSSSGENAFRNVVIVEYPRKGLYSLGFLTSERGHQIEGAGEGEMMTVFVPTTPNPTSGLFIFVPQDELVFLEMSIEDGLKMIVSGGLIKPERFIRKTRAE